MWPTLRPITSTKMTRSWLSAVVWSLSMASVATVTAVSKPKVRSVMATSLSIVLGTPTTSKPRSDISHAHDSVPSPPTAIRASTARARRVSVARAMPSGRLNGVWREVPSTVPPLGNRPRQDSTSSGVQSSSTTPRQPSRNPMTSSP